MKQYVFTRNKWVDRMWFIITSITILLLWGVFFIAVVSGKLNVATILFLLLKLSLLSYVMKSVWLLTLAEMLSYKKEWIIVTPKHITLNMYKTHTMTWKRVDRIAMSIQGEKANYLIRYRKVVDGPKQVFTTHTAVFKKYTDFSAKRVLNIISLMAYMNEDEREIFIDELNQSRGRINVKKIIKEQYRDQHRGQYSWFDGLTFDRDFIK